MRDVQVNIASTSFPTQFVSDSEKASSEFGIQVGQAIQYEWFKRDGNSCRFYSQWREFNRLRLYSRGEQSVAKYKNELSTDGDLSYLNLAQDAMSSAKRSKYQDMIEAQMVSKDLLLQVQQDFGVDPFTVAPDDLPNSDEELSLYMQLNYKPAIEIAEETAINTLLDQNHYSETRQRVDYDLTTLVIGIAKHEFLKGDGVRVEYVDPANVVYSYTEDPA